MTKTSVTSGLIALLLCLAVTACKPPHPPPVPGPIQPPSPPGTKTS